jgi:hypothetical protein
MRDSDLMKRDLENDQGTEAVTERMIAKATREIEDKMALKMKELNGELNEVIDKKNREHRRAIESYSE